MCLNGVGYSNGVDYEDVTRKLYGATMLFTCIGHLAVVSWLGLLHAYHWSLVLFNAQLQSTDHTADVQRHETSSSTVAGLVSSSLS